MNFTHEKIWLYSIPWKIEQPLKCSPEKLNNHWNVRQKNCITIEQPLFTRKIKYMQKINMEKLSRILFAQIVTHKTRTDFFFYILTQPNSFIIHSTVILTLTGISYVYIYIYLISIYISYSYIAIYIYIYILSL